MRSYNLILTGFRATGKTSVGRIAAEQMQWTFLDSDDLLRQRLGAPIAEVVARHGWAFFREAEEQLLRELTTMRDTVLAAGGGAIEHRQAWDELRRCGLVVWLDAEMATIRKRMQGDPNSGLQRPSLTGQDVLGEVEQLLARRAPLYEAGSDLRIRVENRSPEELAEEIVQALRREQSGSVKQA